MSDLSFGILKSLQNHHDLAQHNQDAMGDARKRAKEPKVDAVSGVNKTSLQTSGPLAQMLDVHPTRPSTSTPAQELEKWQAFNAKRFTDAEARETLARNAAMQAYMDEQAKKTAAQNVSRPGTAPASVLQLQGAPQGPGSPVGVMYGYRQGR